ncbi:MAG TPA: hypothetical protein VIC06_07220 [Solirubrobacteraceae bacterium]|jgi:hypothetical protein
MADVEKGEAEDDELGHDPVNKLGAEVAAQMEAIENDFGDDYKIGAVVTVVEVLTSDGAGVRVRCNAPPWVGLGMLRIAEKALEAQGQD